MEGLLEYFKLLCGRDVVASFVGLFIVAGYKKGETKCQCEENTENAIKLFHTVVLL
jgi:hypothetical protein